MEVPVASERTTIIVGSDARMQVTIQARGARASEVLEKPMSTAGRPSLAPVPIASGDGSCPPEDSKNVAPRCCLVQMRGSSAKPLVLESRCGSFFTPADFDAAEPFRIEIGSSRGDTSSEATSW
jgi:hypothetical protein